MISDSLPLISAATIQAALSASSNGAVERVAPENLAANQSLLQAKVTQASLTPQGYVLTLDIDGEQLQVKTELPLPPASVLRLLYTEPEKPTDALLLKVLSLSLPNSPEKAQPDSALIKDFISARLPLLQQPSSSQASPIYQKPNAATVTMATAAPDTRPAPALLTLLNQINNQANISSTQAVPDLVKQILQTWQSQLPSPQQLGQVGKLMQSVQNSGLSYENKIALELQKLLPQAAATNLSESFKKLWHKASALGSVVLPNNSSSLNSSSINSSSGSAPTTTPTTLPSSTNIEEILQKVRAKLETNLDPSPSKAATAAPTVESPSMLQAILSQDQKAVLSRALLTWAKQIIQNTNNHDPAMARSLPTQNFAATLATPQAFKLLQSALAQIENEQVRALQQPDQSQLNIPLFYRDQGNTSAVQMFIDQEPNHDTANNEQKHSWRIRLYFDLAELGPLDIDLFLSQQQLSATFWSRQSATLNKLNQSLQPLRKRLTEMGVEVSELQAKHGQLPEPVRNQIAQQWVNIKV